MDASDLQPIASGLAYELEVRFGVKPKVVVCSYYDLEHERKSGNDELFNAFSILIGKISVTVTHEKFILSIPSDSRKLYNDMPISGLENIFLSVMIDKDPEKIEFELADPTSIDKLIARIDACRVYHKPR